MMKRIDSSDHLRLSIVLGKNNLSGILWMWNPLMRFLLFLHYTHIVSARWGPLVGQGRPRAGIVRGNHQAGWHTGPRLKFSFLGNQFRDQGSILRTAKGTVRYTPPIDRFLALFPLVILNHQAFLSLYEICVQKNSAKKGNLWLCKMMLIPRNVAPFPKEATNASAGNPLTLPSISILASTTPIIFTQTRLLRAFEASDSFSNHRFAQESTHWGLQWELQRQAPTPKIKLQTALANNLNKNNDFTPSCKWLIPNLNSLILDPKMAIRFSIN